MASSAAARRLSIPLLLVAIVQLGLLSVSVAGRPCKTLFISSYTFTLRRGPGFPHNPNPARGAIYLNLPASDPSSSSSSGFVTIFTTTTAFRAVQRNPAIALSREALPGYQAHPQQQQQQQQQQEEERKQDDIFGLFDFGSLRERSKDILSVVVALLFGVGCGALTAVTMYMAWAVFSSGGSGHYFQESDDECDCGYDYDASPKKMGYVKIPAPDPSPAPAKA